MPDGRPLLDDTVAVLNSLANDRLTG